jgi:hypothetical protein
LADRGRQVGLVALLRRVTGVPHAGEHCHPEEKGGTMNQMTADQFGRIPEGMEWCPHRQASQELSQVSLGVALLPRAA